MDLCFASIFEECTEKSINSHTISQTNLRLIAEDGHLLSFKVPELFKAIDNDKKLYEEIKLTKIGLKSVSAFPGFCAAHDTSIFSSIDTQTLEITGQTCQLLVFRTFVHEAYKKICGQYKLESFQYADKKIDLQRVTDVNSFELGSTDLLTQAKQIYENIKTKKSEIKYVSFKFSETLPFCFIAPINFEIKPSFGGKDPYAQVFYESCLIGLLPTSFGSTFVIAFPRSQIENVRIFLDRLGRNKEEFPKKILQLALQSCENLFFKLSWVEELPDASRNLLKEIFAHDLGVSDVLQRDILHAGMLKTDIHTSVQTNTLSVRKWKSKLR